MMDKYLASTILTCRRFEASRVSIDRGRLLTRRAGEGYRRFALGGDGISERARLGVEGAEFWCTGDEHDEAGHITEDPVVRAEMMRKRLSREGLALRAIPDAEQATGALFARSMGREPDHYILKYTGRAMTSTELAGALRRVAGGTAGRREVLTYGA